MRTRDTLAAITIGSPTRLDAAVELCPYNPQWPLQFKREAAKIRAALGGGGLDVQHMGSTSVPGLAAKPIIDILLIVGDSGDEPAYLPPLERAGYSLRIREPQWHEHRMLCGETPSTHLHVYSKDCPEIARILAFRDRLRCDPAERALYAAVKRDLAMRTWAFVQDYADAKSAVIESIIQRACAAA